MLLACIAVVGGLALLSYGADRFVDGAAAIARNLDISPLVVGLTVVGIATSLPEILVGSLATLQGRIEIAIGNAIGSNIANTALVLGVTAVVYPLVLTSESIRREYLLMAAAALVAGALLYDLDLSRLDGAILLGGLIVSVFLIIRLAHRAMTADSDPLISESDQEYESGLDWWQAVFRFLLGLVLVLGAAELLVRGAVTIAQAFGVSDLIIGLTIIAVGTSLPELAASITSTIKHEADIAIGNVIGSNMFNMWAVLGLPALLRPDTFSEDVIARDFPIMLALSLLMGLLLFAKSRGRLDRWEGLLLLACFCGYQAWLFVDPGPVG